MIRLFATMLSSNAAKLLKSTREQAWVGDAVLALHVRRFILDKLGKMDGEMATRMTSNQFLSGRGNPTEVEAKIGRIYEREGYDSAVAWIEAELLPLYERQEKKRRRNISR